jgi:acyl carrier protein
MGPEDIDTWDSLNHLRLITEVESSFSVQLSMQQIQKIQSLSDLVDAVATVTG